MEITIIHKDENDIHFLIENVDVAFANALRRTMLARLPAMAIDEVLINIKLLAPAIYRTYFE